MKPRILAVIALFIGITLSGYCNNLLSLVPQDSYLVVNLDFASIVKQPEIRAMIDDKMKLGDHDYADFYKKAGIEPSRDIKNITVFLTSKEKSGVLVNGTFDVNKISELIQSDKDISGKFRISEIAGLQAVKNDKNANGNMLFVNKNTVAFGPEDILEHIAKLEQGKAAGINKNKHFSELITKVDTNSDLWGAVMASPNWAQRMKMPVTGLQDMKSGFFSFDYDKEFIMVFTGLVDKEKQLAGFVEGMKNLLDAFKGWTASVPEFASLLNKATVQDDRKKMARIVLAVPAAEFKASMNKLSDRLEKEEKK
ncbi:MAG: hypothetical protein Kow0029_22330 [Candidatus Rifleibacteriota bacterium]